MIDSKHQPQNDINHTSQTSQNTSNHHFTLYHSIPFHSLPPIMKETQSLRVSYRTFPKFIRNLSFTHHETPRSFPILNSAFEGYSDFVLYPTDVDVVMQSQTALPRFGAPRLVFAVVLTTWSVPRALRVPAAYLHTVSIVPSNTLPLLAPSYPSQSFHQL